MRMPATVAAIQRRVEVRKVRLVRIDFASGPMFLHQGLGPLKTADGQVWQGVGNLGGISQIDRSVVASDGGPTLTLSGVDDALVGKTLAASSEAKGRPARIFEQHFDADWGLLDAPQAIYLGLIDRMYVRDDGPTASIVVSLVTVLYMRRRALYQYLSHTSQQQRYPGDLGAREIPSLVQSRESWPNY